MTSSSADWTFAEYLAAIHGKLRPRYRPEDVYLGNLLGRLEALNSNIKVIPVEGGPHNIGWTFPEECNRALLEFLG